MNKFDELKSLLEEKEEWHVEYFPATSDKLKIVTGFTSEPEAMKWAKGEQLTDAEDFKITKVNKK